MLCYDYDYATLIYYVTVTYIKILKIGGAAAHNDMCASFFKIFSKFQTCPIGHVWNLELNFK